LDGRAHRCSGLSQEQIKHEFLSGRDLSKKGSAARGLAYAERTAMKAITLSATESAFITEKTHESRDEMDTCIICSQNVQPQKNGCRVTREEPSRVFFLMPTAWLAKTVPKLIFLRPKQIRPQLVTAATSASIRFRSAIAV